MFRSRLVILIGVAAITCGFAEAEGGAAQSSSQAMQRGQVRLEAEDGKTNFKLGDPITLELVFSDPGYTPADKPKSTMDLLEGKGPQLSLNTTEYGDLAEDVSISPTTGWYRWRGPRAHD